MHQYCSRVWGCFLKLGHLVATSSGNPGIACPHHFQGVLLVAQRHLFLPESPDILVLTSLPLQLEVIPIDYYLPWEATLQNITEGADTGGQLGPQVGGPQGTPVRGHGHEGKEEP